MSRLLKKINKRKAIAKSTCELFISKGFVNISISEIAKVAGIGKGTIYEYFVNKEDIVFELMSCLQEDYDPKLKKCLEKSQSIKEKIKHLFSLYLSQDAAVQTQRDIYKEFLAITLNNPSTAIIKYQNNMMEKYTHILLGIIQEGIDKNELKENAVDFIPSIFATLDGFFIARKPKEMIAEYIDNLISLLEKKEG
jgi:AcrR family transcriptional regulator